MENRRGRERPPLGRSLGGYQDLLPNGSVFMNYASCATPHHTAPHVEGHVRGGEAALCNHTCGTKTGRVGAPAVRRAEQWSANRPSIMFRG